jgi:pyruvate dehydrogenase E1 component beta subunit
MSIKNISKALHDTLQEEMARDASIFCIGEEVGTAGIYGITTGLHKIFGSERVIASPISESGIVGLAVGAAMVGMRPVAELMYIDFIGVCMDQIINQAAKFHFMTGGQVKIPMVLLMTMGSGRRNAGQHSQCLESMLAHTPGLKLVAPTTPYDAAGLLRASIRDDDPVMFIGHKFLYNIEGEVPEEDYMVPLGKGALRREGKDVTIIAWSRQVNYALEAALLLEKEGVQAEIIDLRSLVPLDWQLISDSVKKTGHVVISEECVKRGGYGSEIASQIADELFFNLKAPIKVVGAHNIVPPFSFPLEDAFFPHPVDIFNVAKLIVG